MNASDRAHLAAHAKRIAQMERVLNRELKEIERERERPFWFYPTVSFIVVSIGMGIVDAVILIVERLF